MPGTDSTTSYAKTAGKLADDYNKSMDILKAAVDSNSSIQKANRDIMNMNSWLISIIIFITITGIILLYLQLIRHTHRISGPIFIMSKYIREILDGKSPDMRDLREKDEFKEYFSLFRQMGERLIELEKKEKKGQGKI
jgi:signal transduction histidine kinase